MSLNSLLDAAKERMSKAPYSPHIVYAEIFFLTDAELFEFNKLKRAEIEQQGDAADAELRLKVKIAKRAASRKTGWL